MKGRRELCDFEEGALEDLGIVAALVVIGFLVVVAVVVFVALG